MKNNCFDSRIIGNFGVDKIMKIFDPTRLMEYIEGITTNRLFEKYLLILSLPY